MDRYCFDNNVSVTGLLARAMFSKTPPTGDIPFMDMFLYLAAYAPLFVKESISELVLGHKVNYISNTKASRKISDDKLGIVLYDYDLIDRINQMDIVSANDYKHKNAFGYIEVGKEIQEIIEDADNDINELRKIVGNYCDRKIPDCVLELAKRYEMIDTQ